MRRIIPLSPVFSQEFAPDTQSQASALLPLQGELGVFGASKRVRTSFTALSLALSLGAVGSLVSSAEAADSMQLAALPSVAGGSNTLPSFGSARPEAAPAIFHTVTDGETIWGIAEQHGLTVEAIRAANGMAEDQVIQVGQVLKVPTVDETDTQELPAYSVSSLNLSVTPAQSPATPDLTVAALPEASMPGMMQATIVDELPEATSAESSLDAAAELGVSEASGLDEASINAEPLGQNSGLSKTDLLRSSKPLASLPTAQPQVESVQEFADQLGVPAEQPEGSQKATVSPRTEIFRDRGNEFTHRVGSGETIWSIARSYGLDPDDLQALNQVADSRRLMPGDELVIPATEATLASVADVDGLRPHQADSSEQIVAALPDVAVVPTSAAAVDLTKVELGRNSAASSSPTVEAEADPFVATLLSQATASTELRSDQAEALKQSSDLSAASDARDVERLAAAPEVARGANEVALNPQFVNNSEPEALDVEAELEADNLLAAAPLGSEVYSPIVENATGRVVTPEMPMLPGQDAYLPEAPNRFDGYMWPAQGVLTSGYGWRWGRMHRGVDIAGPVGTPIYAAAPGVVVSSGWNSGGYGNLVDIRHADGSMTRYAHNSRLIVRAGQQVRQGQQIAEMGSTGFSTGPHLHFEIHIPNQGTVNPIAMLPRSR
ncbi:LysM peptidoglycan-binding domain-containing protein [Leptolyngbya iicbica LK]|uniref:LysM peptidoglycan-binding domain-containing protein n=1 Tax=Leptolyngbya iicbica LK TaxID=2294035 RepID=A0A4Q7EFX1_9CYAN|nr:LysM peptidoglycan-binding domain-containing protein [Leptolyngbya sp. LK]